MKFELKPNSRGMSNDELAQEIKRVDSLVNKNSLTMEDFYKTSKIHPDTLRKRFGSWKNALIAASLEHKFAILPENVKTRQSTQIISNEKIIDEIKRISKTLGQESITMEEFRKNSEIIHPKTISKRFGSWEVALNKAGLEISKMGKRYSLEDYFENMLEVWTFHGRQPFYREMDEPPSKITSGGYEARFGGWRKALEAFVARMNSDEREVAQVFKEEKPNIEQTEIKKEPEITKQKRQILGEDRRNIGLSLRYKVLSRDNFKCVRCGRSPATNIGVELHVDHKLPFSMGGKTVLENLETKCKECNLGKSNRHSE